MARMALAALIDDTITRNGWSAADVARQAVERGRNLTTQDISTWRHNGMKSIKPEKVKALAAGLHLPAYVVVQAIMADHGIDVPVDASTPEDAVRRDYTLSERTRDHVLLLIQSERTRS